MTQRLRDQILKRLEQKKGGTMSGTLASLIWELRVACSTEQLRTELDYLVRRRKIYKRYLAQTGGHLEIVLRRSRKSRPPGRRAT